MKRINVTIGFVFLLAATAGAQMGADRSRQGMPGAGAELADVLGTDLMAACRGGLDQLGLPPETKKAVEDKHFELKRKMIRGVADLRVQRLELGKLLEKKSFDLGAAKQKVAETTAKQAELQSLHLDFLAELRSSLTDEQWMQLRKAGESKGAMMHRDAGEGMKPGTDDTMPCMQGDGMRPSKPECRDAHPKRAGRKHETKRRK